VSTAGTARRRASTAPDQGEAEGPPVYGILERQFHGYYEEATRKRGRTGENLLQILETRLDKRGLPGRFREEPGHGRQLVTHGHFLVNGKKVDIPSYRVGESDIVEVAPSPSR